MNFFKKIFRQDPQRNLFVITNIYWTIFQITIFNFLYIDISFRNQCYIL